MNQLIPLKLSGDGFEISITPEAEKKRKALIESANQITHVNDAPSCSLAKECLKGLADFTNLLEKTRKEVKEPVIDLGRKIDSCAKQCGEPIESHKARISKMISDHAAEQARIQREALERQRQAELELQRRALEEEKLRLEAERKALAAEQAILNAETKKQWAAAEAKAEESRKKDEAARQAQLELESANQKKAEEDLAVRSSAPIQGVRPTLDYEIVDINALYKVYPGLCEITVKRRDILSCLKGMQDAGEPVGLPGLKVIERYAVSTR